MNCPKCKTELHPGDPDDWGNDGNEHNPSRCRDALLTQLTHEREARAVERVELEHARLMLGAIKAWSSRSGHTYAEELAISGLSAPPHAGTPVVGTALGINHPEDTSISIDSAAPPPAKENGK